uniref:Uncharacterized protein n=1 Tax=Glossina pallidipes TaxID=7398 RepID=A0A1A9Z0F8_GLOPL
MPIKRNVSDDTGVDGKLISGAWVNEESAWFSDFATVVVGLAAAGEGVSSGNECKCTVDEAIVTQDALVSKVEEVEGVNEAVDELTIAMMSIFINNQAMRYKIYHL